MPAAFVRFDLQRLNHLEFWLYETSSTLFRKVPLNSPLACAFIFGHPCMPTGMQIVVEFPTGHEVCMERSGDCSRYAQ